MADKFVLKRRTFKDVTDNTPDERLPVAATGTLEELNAYAKERGFEFRSNRKHLFGGWWYKKPDGQGFEGESLEFDVDPKLLQDTDK